MLDTLHAQLDKLHEKTQDAVLKAQCLILGWPHRNNPNWSRPYHVQHREAYDIFEAARTLFTGEARRALIAAGTPADDIDGVHPETTAHDAGLWLAERVLTTFNLSCGGPHDDPLPPRSWEQLKRRLDREHAEAVRLLPASGPAFVAPPVDSPPASFDPTGGFPHHRRYLSGGMANSFGNIWPRAERQLGAFFRHVEVANRKLVEHGARLPDALVGWWVREWAEAVLWHTTFGGYGVADIRALYLFGRRVDRELRLSDALPDASHPRDVEFTFYDRSLIRDDGRGNCRPELLTTHGYRMEERAGFVPVPFPRTEPDRHALAPRIGCDGFLHWAGFLAAVVPLTADQLTELGHVGYSEDGRDGWCRVSGTHAEQCGRIAESVRDRLRSAIVHVSDALGIAVQPIARDGRFHEALDAASGWLARATPPPTAPNAGRAERPTTPTFPPPAPIRPDPILQHFDRESFSPWERSPTEYEVVRDQPVRPTVLTLGDLVGQLRTYADGYYMLTSGIRQDASVRYDEAVRDDWTNIARGGLASYPWFDELRTRLRVEFGAEPSAAAVNRFINRLSQERSLTIAQVEAMSIEQALASPAEPSRPVWDATTRALVAGEWRGTVRRNGTTVIAILTAFEAAGWPETAVPMETVSTAQDRKKCVERFLVDAPIEIRPDGTGNGMTWHWRLAD